MKKEHALEKDTRSKDQIERWLAMRKIFMSTLQLEITHSELQKTFCEKGSPEWNYHNEYVQILKRQRDTYGN